MEECSLGLDHALGGESEADELVRDTVAELGLGRGGESRRARAGRIVSGAISRAFAVSSSAWQASPGESTSTSFETIRCR